MQETNKFAVIKARQKQAIVIDELSINGSEQSKIITLPLKNTGTEDITLVFGTPLGSIEEYQNVPMYNQIVNHYLDNLADLDGEEAVKRLLNLNKRMLRHPVMIGQIEAITPDDVNGIKQRSQKVTELTVPLNDIDGVRKGGAYVPQNTFITGASLLNQVKTFGEFFGIAYILKANSEVNFNFYISGVDTPQFAVN